MKGKKQSCLPPPTLPEFAGLGNDSIDLLVP